MPWVLQAVQAQVNLELLREHVREEMHGRHVKNKSVRGALKAWEQRRELTVEQQRELEAVAPGLAADLGLGLTAEEGAQGLHSWLASVRLEWGQAGRGWG